jgi:hypothetical protein
MARGHPQETVKLPNPLSSRLDRVGLLQNPIPHNHTVNTVVLGLEPPIEGMGRAQAAKVSLSLFSRENGKRELVESLPKIRWMLSLAPVSDPFEESIRNIAKTAMELVNIHDLADQTYKRGN